MKMFQDRKSTDGRRKGRWKKIEKSYSRCGNHDRCSKKKGSVKSCPLCENCNHRANKGIGKNWQPLNEKCIFWTFSVFWFRRCGWSKFPEVEISKPFLVKLTILFLLILTIFSKTAVKNSFRGRFCWDFNILFLIHAQKS